jgi:hypothetical protein
LFANSETDSRSGLWSSFRVAVAMTVYILYINKNTGEFKINVGYGQGDQVWRIFAYWVMIYFGKFFWKLQK